VGCRESLGVELTFRTSNASRNDLRNGTLSRGIFCIWYSRFMSLFTWGEKRFARGVAKAMLRSYHMIKLDDPNASEHELVIRTLEARSGTPAEQLLNDVRNADTFAALGGTLPSITYVLVRMEYIDYMRGTIDEENPDTNWIFHEVISDVMGDLQSVAE
jgi:hypothetical protein